MLTQVKTDKELAAMRLQDIITQIPNGHLSIFTMSSWKEPWGFGRNNAKEAKVIYKEAAVTLGIVDNEDFDCEWSLDDEDKDNVIIAFREGDKIGIISICLDRYEADEVLEDIVNYLIKQRTVPLTAVKSADNTLDIPKMSLFK